MAEEQEEGALRRHESMLKCVVPHNRESGLYDVCSCERFV